MFPLSYSLYGGYASNLPCQIQFEFCLSFAFINPPPSFYCYILLCFLSKFNGIIPHLFPLISIPGVIPPPLSFSSVLLVVTELLQILLPEGVQHIAVTFFFSFPRTSKRAFLLTSMTILSFLSVICILQVAPRVLLLKYSGPEFRNCHSMLYLGKSLEFRNYHSMCLGKSSKISVV